VVKIMHTIVKNRIQKPVVVLSLVLFFWLSFKLPIVLASTSNQTIPTAPPTISATPTITSTSTPTNTPTITVTATQIPDGLASQTPGSATSPTDGSIPSLVPSVTGLPGEGTIPNITATLSPAEATRVASTESYLLTATAHPKINLPGYSEILYCVLCGVIILLLILGLIWFLRSRRKQTD
jgi:hypothetical protein